MTEEMLEKLTHNRLEYEAKKDDLSWLLSIRENYNSNEKNYLTITDYRGIQRPIMSACESDFTLKLKDKHLCISLLDHLIAIVKSEMDELNKEFKEA